MKPIGSRPPWVMTLLFLVLTAGCEVQHFNSGYRSGPRDSEAMNVLRAAVVVRNPRSASVRDLSGSSPGDAAAASVEPGGTWFQPYGPDPRTAAWLASGSAGGQGSAPLFLVWWPAREAASSVAAGEAVRRTVVAAYLNTLGRGYRLDPLGNRTPGSGSDSEMDGAADAPGGDADLWVRGPGCEGDGCPLRLTLRPRRPFRMPAPDFLRRSGDVWFTTVSLRPAAGQWRGGPAEFMALSTYLPAWVYLYVPAGSTEIPYPVLFNAGAPLYFIASGRARSLP